MDVSASGPGRDPEQRPEGSAETTDLGLGARRLLRAGGAVAGLLSLAGCSALGGDADSAAGDAEATPAAQEDAPGPNQGSATGSDGSTTAAPTQTEGPATGPQSTATPAPTATPCPDPDPIESDIRALDAEISDLETTIDEDRQTVARKQGIRGQLPGGWDEAVLASAESLAESVREHVVVLESEMGGGTGWFIDERHIVTNSHVVAGAPEPTVWTVDGEEGSSSLVGRVDSWRPDLALLETDIDGSPLPLGASADLDPGQPVLQVGHPLGFGYWVPSLGRYLRHEEAFGRNADYDDIYTSVVGRQGVSGSPLLNLDGEVVGLTWGGTDRTGPQDPDEPPAPAPERVADYPIAPRVWGQHLPVETVVEYYEAWR